MQQVFISSTFQDLEEHREVLIKALSRANTRFSVMEYFGSRGQDPRQVCFDEIDKCDIFVGIYAMRYGWVPEDQELSITEQEFDYAIEKGKEIRCYVVDKNVWPYGRVEDEEPAKSKLAKFIDNKVSKLVYDKFSADPSDLSTKVMADLTRLLTQETSAKTPLDPLAKYPVHDDIELPKHPFKNLEWFTREDARIFYGRQTELLHFFDLLSRQHLRVYFLFGASGVGKSSFLHAGVQARLPDRYSGKYLRYSSTVIERVSSFLEEIEGQQPVVIIDQLEEVLRETHPALFFEHWFELVEQFPACKFVLSFREDALAEMESQAGAYIYHIRKIRLEHLNVRSVAEAIRGVSQNPELRDSYHMEEPLEEEVEYIARDIVQAQEKNTIAPILQYTLRKIWDNWIAAPIPEKSEQFCIDQVAYQKAKQKGMVSLVEDCLSLVNERYPSDIQNGLILDILDFFVTPEQTARSRTINELKAAYGHLDLEEGLHIIDLCEELCNRYLLQKHTGSFTYRLSHDALAVAIAKLFDQSQAPGQLIRRFLINASDKHYELSYDQLIRILQAPKSLRRHNATQRQLIEEYRKRYVKEVVHDLLQNNDYEAAILQMEEIFLSKGMDTELRRLYQLSYQTRLHRRLSLSGQLTAAEVELLERRISNSFIKLNNSVPFMGSGAEEDLWLCLRLLEKGKLFRAIETFVNRLKFKTKEGGRELLIRFAARSASIERKMRTKIISGSTFFVETARLLDGFLSLLRNDFNTLFSHAQFSSLVKKALQTFLQDQTVPSNVNDRTAISSFASQDHLWSVLQCFFWRSFLKRSEKKAVFNAEEIQCLQQKVDYSTKALVFDAVDQGGDWAMTYFGWHNLLFEGVPESILQKDLEKSIEFIQILSELNGVWHSFLMNQLSTESFMHEIRSKISRWVVLHTQRDGDFFLTEQDRRFLTDIPFKRQELAKWLNKVLLKIATNPTNNGALQQVILVCLGTSSFLYHQHRQLIITDTDFKLNMNILYASIENLYSLKREVDQLSAEEIPHKIRESVREGNLYNASRYLGEFLVRRKVKEEEWENLHLEISREWYETDVLHIRSRIEGDSKRASHSLQLLELTNDLARQQSFRLLPQALNRNKREEPRLIVTLLIRGKWEELYPFLREQIVKNEQYEELSTLSRQYQILRKSRCQTDILNLPTLFRKLLLAFFPTHEEQVVLDFSDFRDDFIKTSKLAVDKILDFLLDSNTRGYQLIEGVQLMRKYEEIQQKHRYGILTKQDYLQLNQQTVAIFLDYLWKYSTRPVQKEQ